MKIWQKWLALLIVGAATILIFLIFRQGREPRYEDRPLSYWIEAIGGEDLYESSKAEQAIKQIGTNALPLALKWIAIKTKPPAWKTYLWPVVRKTRSRTLLFWAMNAKEITRSQSAMLVFYWLGPSAEPAIPQLIKLARHPADENVRERACRALLQIGWRSFPAYVQLLADTNARPDLRLQATRNLNEHLRENGSDGPFDSTTLLAVSPLIRNLGDPDPTVAAEGATALGLLGLQPELTLPALTDALKDPRPQVREAAVKAIKLFVVNSNTNNPPE